MKNTGWTIILFFWLFAFGFVLTLPAQTIASPLDNWQWRNPLPTNGFLSGITYGNNTFVAVGYSGTILTSPDGIVWTARAAVVLIAFLE